MLLSILQEARKTPGEFCLDVEGYASKPRRTTTLERQRARSVSAAAKVVSSDIGAALTFGKRAYIKRWWGGWVQRICAPYSGHTQMARRVTWHELAHATCAYPGLDRYMGSGNTFHPDAAREEVRAELAAIAMILLTEEQVETVVLDVSLNYLRCMLDRALVFPSEHPVIVAEVELIVAKLKEISDVY